MKYFCSCIALILFGFVSAQNIAFDDAILKAKLVAASPANTTAKNLAGAYFKIDADGDGEISVVEALEVSALNLRSTGIHSLTSLDSFENLQTLDCGNNVLSNFNHIAQIDLSNLSSLVSLDCIDANVSSIVNTSAAPLLKFLRATGNDLPDWNLSDFPALETFACIGCDISTFNLPGDSTVKYLTIAGNHITTFNLSPNTALETISFEPYQPGALDFSIFPNLKSMNIWSNVTTGINLSGLTNFEEFYGNGGSLQMINTTGCTSLKKFTAWGNSLTSLDLQSNTNLEYLDVNDNWLQQLNLSNNPHLNFLECDGNNITTLDLSQNTKLTYLNVGDTEIATLDVRYQHELGIVDFRGCSYLQSVYLKNGVNNTVSLQNCPQLTYICADIGETPDILQKLSNAGMASVVVDDACELSVADAFTAEVSIYPNPVGEMLHIDFDGLSTVNSVVIYNLMGQIVFEQHNVPTSIDVSRLTTGQYILSLMSDQGALLRRFIKQ
ncbi:hypothetical protein FLLO111716_02985 [Flavobacterium longum]|uniref:T9SS type A sorting domain-containing protein n=1 Tax=Flavobacterium longum TaxID=1299340 RepID=UPI0039E8A6AE